MVALNAFHQGRERSLHRSQHNHRVLDLRRTMEPLRILLVQHPLQHGPGHDRKAGHKMHATPASAPAAEARNFVETVGNDLRSDRKNPHVQAVHIVRALWCVRLVLLARHVLHAFFNQHLGFGVQLQRDAQGTRRALARLVIGGGTNATRAKNGIARVKRTLQNSGDAACIIARIFGIGQCQPARCQQLDHLGKVLVGTLAGENFVTDDDETKGVGHKGMDENIGGCNPESAPSTGFQCGGRGGDKSRRAGARHGIFGAQAFQRSQAKMREPQGRKSKHHGVNPDP